MMVVKIFLKSEAAGGIILMAAALAALIVANSALYPWYSNLLYAPTGPILSEKLGPMNVHLWVNDGLMAIFFLLVGLEIKREFVDGRLVTWDQRRYRHSFCNWRNGVARQARANGIEIVSDHRCHHR